MLLLTIFAWGYQHAAKPILFLFSPEFVHEGMTSLGEFLGQSRVVRFIFRKLFTRNDPRLTQEVAGISFTTPVGLSAGFDYEAKLTQILPCVGFGFQTVGTITNNPYGGNPRPMLGRLPKSRSLMVNKGFKNMGVAATLRKLSRATFGNAVGISIGRTNTKKLVTIAESIQDICEAFGKVEKSRVPFSYYELNISCPNLYGNLSFYPPNNLRKLLGAIKKLHLSKPVFIKMPIEQSNADVLAMLHVITTFPVAGVIFGNLQKDRKDPSLDPSEVRQFHVGYFSGKPTEKRSNELIALSYKHFGKTLVIVGCGGIFSAKDAYRKIRLGATLVQLITGMIYQGPQLISQINHGLAALLKQDGFQHISEAVGVDAKKSNA